MKNEILTDVGGPRRFARWKNAQLAPDVGLVTKNVLVPVTKTVFGKKCSRARSGILEKRVEVVKSRRCSNKPALSLLRRPCYSLPEGRAKSLPETKQARRFDVREERDLSKKVTYTPGKKSKGFKKKDMLPFPSSTLDFLNTLIAKQESTTTHKPNIDDKSASQARRSPVKKTSDVKLHKKPIHPEKQPSPVASNSPVNSPRIDELSVDSLTTIFDKEFRAAKNKDSDDALSTLLATILTSSISEKAASSMNFGSRECEALLLATQPPDFRQGILAQENRFEVWSTRKPQYSWEDIDRSTLTETSQLEDPHSCKIKYSWQVIGRGSQTSRTLLEDLVKEELGNHDVEPGYECSIKYSWQIVGTETQTSVDDFNAYSPVSVLSARMSPRARENKAPRKSLPVTIHRNGKKYFVLNNQCIQTAAHKENQTNFMEMREKCR